LAVGEALVSLLQEKGTPAPVQRGLVIPPGGQIGPITPDQRQQIIKASTVYGHYEKVIDRESAYEILKQRSAEAAATQMVEEKETEIARRPKQPATAKPRQSAQVIAASADAAARSVGPSFGREIMRGILVSLFGGSKKK